MLPKNLASTLGLSFSCHTTLAGGRGLRSIPGGPWGTPWRQADILLRVLRAPAASSWGQRLLPPWHPRRRALPNSVNPLMLVTMRPQGRWRAVSMETQTCLGSTGRGGELAAGFSKGLLGNRRHGGRTPVSEAWAPPQPLGCLGLSCRTSRAPVTGRGCSLPGLFPQPRTVVTILYPVAF